jgi:FkbM family methyltransferase
MRYGAAVSGAHAGESSFRRLAMRGDFGPIPATHDPSGASSMQITHRFGRKNNKLAKRVFRFHRLLANWTRPHLTVEGDRTSYAFTPNTRTELHRYLNFFVKEEGTLAWLRDSLREGDVFVDIGANVGLYSIFAAKLGRNVKVFAFEPHKPNFMALMQNVVENGLQGSVAPMALGLSDKSEVIRLNYYSLEGGSSRSQLGHKSAAGAEFAPKFEEIVPAMSLDDLIARGIVPPPSHIKLDVDGNEISILRGMTTLLQGPHKPRSIQVEMNWGEQAPILELLDRSGYALTQRHYTRKGKRKISRGAKAEEIPHNAVFTLRNAG